MAKDSYMNRWTVIAGALMIQIILGTVYGFSVFVRPLEMEFGWSRATTQWAFSFALATFAISMIPAGRLQDRIGPRKVASGLSISPTASLAAPASASVTSARLPRPSSGTRTSVD
jgi:MFS family permease